MPKTAMELRSHFYSLFGFVIVIDFIGTDLLLVVSALLNIYVMYMYMREVLICSGLPMHELM